MTFLEGEQALSAWMAKSAFASWVVRDRPWELKDELITVLDLPLNLQGNPHNRFHSVLTGVRARCVVQAKARQRCPIPASEAGGPEHRCVDSNRDSNSSNQRRTSAVGSTRERSHFASSPSVTAGQPGLAKVPGQRTRKDRFDTPSPAPVFGGDQGMGR